MLIRVKKNAYRSLSRIEKESKYSSKLLPTGDLLKLRNSYLDSAAGMKTTTVTVTNEVKYDINIVVFII